MTKPITTKQLLDFLVKADKASCHPLGHVSFKKVHGEYEISINCDWDNDDIFYIQKTFISEEGHSTWETSDYEFFTMEDVLNVIVNRKEKEEIKKQKRQELLSRLTDEEKELLGVNS